MSDTTEPNPTAAVTASQETTNPTTTTVQSTTTNTPEPPPAQTPSAPSEPVSTGEGGEKLFGERYVHQLREEAKSNRLELQKAIADAEAKAQTAAQEAADRAKAELTQSLGRALGLVNDENPPSPEQLLEQAKAAQAEAEQQRAAAEQAAASAAATARAASVEAEVYRRATTAGADPLALIDSRQFMQRADVQALDPSSAEFSAQVDAVIRAAVEADPGRYRAARIAAPRSGGDVFAGNADPNSGSSTTSVQQFIDEKFKTMSGGKGGKVHGRFLRGVERGQSAEPVVGQG